MDDKETMIEILTPGIHTLNLWMREDGFMVDKVILTTDANFDPATTDLELSKTAFKQSQDGSGLVEIEAEQYHSNIASKDHKWTMLSDNKASANEAITTPNKGIKIDTDFVDESPRLDYTINFNETGDHYVWVLGRADSKTVGSSNSLHIGLDGKEVDTSDRINGFDADFGWLNQTMDGTPAMLDITSTGVHTLNLWMREDGFIADKVILSRNINFDPNDLDLLQVPDISDNPSVPNDPKIPDDLDVPGGDDPTDLTSKPFIPRQEPTANVSYDNPPFATKAWKQSWGAGQGLAPQLWFWEEVPEYEEFERQINGAATKHKNNGRVPVTGLQLWKSAFSASQPNEANSQKPGHKAWVEWIEARPEYLGVSSSGNNFGWGYVSPLVPLNKEDYPENYEGDVAYYADWQAERLGRLAAFTGIQGFIFSDFFDSHPHTGPQNYFNPLIIKDFENSTGINLSSETIKDQAQEIRSEHYQEWLDHWVDRWAYNWSAMDREIRRHTGEEPWLVSQTSFTPAAIRRYGAIDVRAISQYMSPDNFILNVQTVQPFMMRKLAVPESRESAMIGLFAAREPEGRYGHIIMSSERRYWGAVDKLWPKLDDLTQEELGWKRLKRTWLESGWTHVATRQGDIRRATESWQRSYHDKGEIDESWVELLRDIDPTKPFGPAIYYSESIESAVEKNAGADSNPIGSSYLGQHLKPITDIKESGVPFNYYVSDAALENIGKDFNPTAWIVPERSLNGKDLLPEDEQKLLEEIAPVLSEEQAKQKEHPLSFTNSQNRTITGFGFYDQNDRLIVVASDQIKFGETNSKLGSVKTTVNLKLSDGNYTAQNLLTGKEIDFKATSGSGKFETDIERWDTQVFAITPKA